MACTRLKLNRELVAAVASRECEKNELCLRQIFKNLSCPNPKKRECVLLIQCRKLAVDSLPPLVLSGGGNQKYGGSCMVYYI